MQLQSERLLLREFQINDYYLFSSIFSNEIVMKYSYMNCITDEGDMLSYFKRVIGNNSITQRRSSYEYAVFSTKDGDFIGFADIEIKYQNLIANYGEIGYFLLPDYWGKGFATEIAKLLIDLCFTRLNLHKVVASCNAKNLQSEKVMKKVGMIKEGELRNERYKNGKWDNELRYGILIEEWDGKVFQADL